MAKAYFRCGSFRILGNAGTTHNLLSIENAAASPYVIVIERFMLSMEAEIAASWNAMALNGAD